MRTGSGVDLADVVDEGQLIEAHVRAVVTGPDTEWDDDVADAYVLAGAEQVVGTTNPVQQVAHRSVGPTGHRGEDAPHAPEPSCAGQGRSGPDQGRTATSVSGQVGSTVRLNVAFVTPAKDAYQASRAVSSPR
jgi:hypothetical protein